MADQFQIVISDSGINQNKKFYIYTSKSMFIDTCVWPQIYITNKSFHNMDENLYKLLTWFTGIVINANDMIPFLFEKAYAGTMVWPCQ